MLEQGALSSLPSLLGGRGRGRGEAAKLSAVKCPQEVRLLSHAASCFLLYAMGKWEGAFLSHGYLPVTLPSTMDSQQTPLDQRLMAHRPGLRNTGRRLWGGWSLSSRPRLLGAKGGACRSGMAVLRWNEGSARDIGFLVKNVECKKSAQESGDIRSTVGDAKKSDKE